MLLVQWTFYICWVPKRIVDVQFIALMKSDSLSEIPLTSKGFGLENSLFHQSPTGKPINPPHLFSHDLLLQSYHEVSFDVSFPFTLFHFRISYPDHVE